MYNTSLHYGPYVYPRWGKALGVCMATVSCLQIFIWAVVAISKETGTLKEVCVSSSLYASVSVRLNLWHKLFLLLFFFSPIAAVQKINPTPELLEGQQRQQRCEDRRTNGAGESWGSVHRHSHRHGFQCTDVGGREPSVRQKRAARRAKDKDKKDYALFIPARLVVRLCPAGQCRFLILFILCIFQLYFYFFFIWNGIAASGTLGL